jgi:hypothetical protein
MTWFVLPIVTLTLLGIGVQAIRIQGLRGATGNQP